MKEGLRRRRYKKYRAENPIPRNQPKPEDRQLTPYAHVRAPEPCGHHRFYGESFSTGPRDVPLWVWQNAQAYLMEGAPIHFGFDYFMMRKISNPAADCEQAIRARLARLLIDISCQGSEVIGQRHVATFCITRR